LRCDADATEALNAGSREHERDIRETTNGIASDIDAFGFHIDGIESDIDGFRFHFDGIGFHLHGIASDIDAFPDTAPSLRRVIARTGNGIPGVVLSRPTRSR
jgi:hypothetical protein